MTKNVKESFKENAWTLVSLWTVAFGFFGVGQYFALANVSNAGLVLIGYMTLLTLVTSFGLLPGIVAYCRDAFTAVRNKVSR